MGCAGLYHVASCLLWKGVARFSGSVNSVSLVEGNEWPNPFYAMGKPMSREEMLTEAMASIEDLILLPKPRSIVARSGAYGLTRGSKIICQGDSIVLLFPIAHRLQQAVWENQRYRLGLAGR